MLKKYNFSEKNIIFFEEIDKIHYENTMNHIYKDVSS